MITASMVSICPLYVYLVWKMRKFNAFVLSFLNVIRNMIYVCVSANVKIDLYTCIHLLLWNEKRNFNFHSNSFRRCTRHLCYTLKKTLSTYLKCYYRGFQFNSIYGVVGYQSVYCNATNKIFNQNYSCVKVYICMCIKK